MATRTKDLWGLVKGKPYVDSTELAEAIREQVGRAPLDFRTRLLIRDSMEALKSYWSEERLRNWLARCPERVALEAIWAEDLGKPGFPSLVERIMSKTDPEDIRRFLRDLSMQVHRPVRLLVGGSAALILPGQLSRVTDDIDVVDEIPAEVRSLHQLHQELKKRYGLHLAHFQSHYLPSAWERRLHSVAPFGNIQVYLVDPYDVVVSKLFSERPKDRDDLQMVVSQMDKEVLTERVRRDTAPLRADEKLRQAAEKNWYILFGESLPT